jgi:hypothetical protein
MQISIFYWRIWKPKTAHTSIRVVKIHPTKINYTTGTGEYLSQVSLPELDTDLLNEEEVAFIEIPTIASYRIRHRISLYSKEWYTLEKDGPAVLCNALKISEGLSNSLELSAPHANTLVPISSRNQATNLLYRLLQSNLVDKWAALQIDRIHSTLSWLLSLIRPPEADVPHYASIHLWRAHCLIKTLCMWIPAQHMTFGFAQSPAAVSDLALPQFLSPVLPARNTLLGPA